MIQEYIIKRLNNLKSDFSDVSTKIINRYVEKYGQNFNTNHPIISFGYTPKNVLSDKGESDKFSIELWNDIFPIEYNVNRVDHIKDAASRVIQYYDANYPNGENMNVLDNIRYVTAFSSSSFLGIQNPRKSSLALQSMIKTLKSHCQPRMYHRSWLIPNLDFLKNIISQKPEYMSRTYGDVCLNSKMSSSSIPGQGKYRDFVMEHSLIDIVKYMNEKKYTEYCYYAGIRIDRRAKYRLIFSMSAIFRIIDFLINNGSYALCAFGGPLSRYTTENFTYSEIWKEMQRMSERGEYILVCLDYTGYDTQLYTSDYIEISRLLNSHRMSDPAFGAMFKWYENWLSQPKPLVTREERGLVPLIPKVQTLASGLHGTHSFENLIGISTYFHLNRMGINVNRLWANGDDQNFKVKRGHEKQFFSEIEKYFQVNRQKSLSGHKLGVWSKMWFSEDFYPFSEIGTFRSIWEREGGEVDMVESSKFQSNYCKIVLVAMLFLRMGKSDDFVINWTKRLCEISNPKIDPFRIPMTLENINQTKVGKRRRTYMPKGLESAKRDLLRRTFNLRTLEVSNYFDMLKTMYQNRAFFTLEPQEIRYLTKGTRVIIDQNFDYSYRPDRTVPWIYAKFVVPEFFTPQQTLVRSILQGTKSYDGPVHRRYEFYDMLSLAKALHSRNHVAWQSK